MRRLRAELDEQRMRASLVQRSIEQLLAARDERRIGWS